MFQTNVLNLFSKCAYVVTKVKFNNVKDQLNIGNSRVKSFIIDLSKEHYSNAYFQGMCYSGIANNLTVIQ